MKATRTKMDILEAALLQYYIEKDAFPVQLTDLEAEGYISDGSSDNHYLYDYWKESFCYQTSTGAWGNNPCRLWSKGQNMADDSGAGDDITVNPGTWDIDPAGIREG